MAGDHMKCMMVNYVGVVQLYSALDTVVLNMYAGILETYV